jgi:hypothetical protein
MNICASYLNVGLLYNCIYILLLAFFYSLLTVHMIKIEIVHSDIWNDYILIEISFPKESTSLLQY